MAIMTYKDYYEKNKEKIREYSKNKYFNDETYRNHRIEYSKNYIKKNGSKNRYIKKEKPNLTEEEKSEIKKQKRREYYQKCKKSGKIKEWVKNYKSNPNVKIAFNLRSRISSAIKRLDKDNIKYKNSMELIGCSIENLHNYLESKFVDGMSWNNYGFRGWHIDHIIPCSSFDLTDEDNQKKCFHYTNLQPLWWKDNIIKSNKYY